MLVAGPSGAGKSTIAAQFITEGIRQGEAGVVAVFEERPQEYVDRAKGFGLDLETPQHDGRLSVLYLRPLDLSVEETLQAILDAVRATGARRLVIDSLTGFEMALAPGFRTDFRESLYRMIGSLTGSGTTIFSSHAISFLTDDIIRLRFVEIDGQLRKILTIAKMRRSSHATDVREYRSTSRGLIIDEHPLKGYRGLISGMPEPLRRPGAKKVPRERPAGPE